MTIYCIKRKEKAIAQHLLLCLIFLTLFIVFIMPCKAADVTVDVDASQVVRDIPATVIGGNEVYSHVSALWLLYDKIKDNGLSKMGWRVAMWDDAWGIHWDTNFVDQRSEVFTYFRNGLDSGCSHLVPPDGCYRDVSGGNASNEMIDYDQGNKFVVDYWGPATDMSHSGKVVKTVNADDAFLRLIFTDKPANPLYARLDVKIDSEKTFNSENNGWVLLTNGANFNVRFTDNRELVMQCRNSANQIVSLATSTQLSYNQYYSLEVTYGNGQCGYWLNGSQVDMASLNTRAAINEIQFGSVDSGLAGVEGQIHLDAVRVDDRRIGTNVQNPWKYQYKAVFTFDNNLRTLDDLAKMSEELGVTLLWDIPVPNKNKPGFVENTDKVSWDYITPQYYVDMVEYLDGVADSDYATKVATLDWTHNTPSDNWANLRASRGRVEPYHQIYFEYGNEPYYAGGFRWVDSATGKYVTDLVGYGNGFVSFAQALRNINSQIKLGAHFMQSGSDNDWFDGLLPIIKNYVGFFSLFHYYGYYSGAATEYWLGETVGNNNSYRYWGGNNRQDWFEATYCPSGSACALECKGSNSCMQKYFTYGKNSLVEGADHNIYLPDYARFKISQFMSGISGASTMPMAITEEGFFMNAGRGEDNWLGTALNRASWIETNIKSGVGLGFLWSSLVSSRFGHGIIVMHADVEDDNIEITPSYYLFKMMADHLGSKLLKSDQTSTVAPYWWTKSTYKTGQGFDILYVSSWASANDSKDRIYVTFINRSQTNSYQARVNFQNFAINNNVKVFMVNGETVCSDNETTGETGNFTSWCPTSDGNSNPENITMKEYSTTATGNNFTYTLPKLSVAVFEVSKNYNPPACTESWSCGGWSSCANSLQSRTCTDTNSCGTTNSRPALTQSCQLVCVPNWTCSAWTSCGNNSQSRTCMDSNVCGTISGRPVLTQGCNSSCSPNWSCSNWSTCSSGNQARTCTDLNSCNILIGKPSIAQTCGSGGGVANGVGENTNIVISSSTNPATASVSSLPLLKYAEKKYIDLTQGGLVKAKDNPNIYFLTKNNSKHLIMSYSSYLSWNNIPLSKQKIQVVSTKTINQYSRGVDITIRPGTKLIKIQNNNSIYAVTPGAVLCPISSPRVAVSLYGKDWTKKVMSISVTNGKAYKIKNDCKITSTAIYPDGSLVRFGGSDKIWYIDGGMRRYVGPTAFKKYKFNINFVINNSSSSVMPIGQRL